MKFNMNNRIKVVIPIISFLGLCSALADCGQQVANNVNEFSCQPNVVQVAPPPPPPAPVCNPCACNPCYCNGCDCGNIITDVGCAVGEGVQDVTMGVGNVITNVGCAVGNVFN